LESFHTITLVAAQLRNILKSKSPIILIHPIPAPYRIDLFNQLSELFTKELSYNFVVLFEYSDVKRRSFWKKNEKNFKFNFIFLKSFILNKNKFDIVPLPSIQSIKQIFSLKPKIIICTGFSFSTLISSIYSKLYNVPFLIWTGENEYSKVNILRHLLRKFLINRAHSMFTYGSASSNFYQKRYNVDFNKMLKIYNIIPINHNINVQKNISNKISLLNEHKLKLIFVGELIEKKGVDLLFNTMTEVHKILDAYKLSFTIIGHGDLKNNLKKEFSKVDFELEFFENLPNEDVLKLIAQNHFFIFPSRREPWGHVILESMSVGTPVLTSKYPGAVQDIIHPSNNSYIVDFKKPVLVAKKIKDSISDIQGYQEFCLNSYSSFDKFQKIMVKNPRLIFNHIKNIIS
jgi:glycosyltransferase involved in cell wall biosynthesis